LNTRGRRYSLKAETKIIYGAPDGLKSYIVLRIIVTTLVLGSGAIIYFGKGARQEAFYLVAIVSVIYFISLVYLLLLSFSRNYPNIFKITQIVLDIVLASGVIYVTGGRTSPFIFLYFLIIIY